jgi:hypothetical protein
VGRIGASFVGRCLGGGRRFVGIWRVCMGAFMGGDGEIKGGSRWSGDGHGCFWDIRILGFTTLARWLCSFVFVYLR